MNIDGLLKHIKKSGCRVRVYNREYIDDARGLFHTTKFGPLISMAKKNKKPKDFVAVLLHEYGHFLQWQDGTMTAWDAEHDGYETWHEWVKRGIDLPENELLIGRNAMLRLEWDAEMRGLGVGKSLDIDDFDEDHYLQDSLAYMIKIKWEWMNRVSWDATRTVLNYKIEPRIITSEELYAPLTEHEKRLIEDTSMEGKSS